MDSTFIPDQNSTAVSLRGGLDASASAASILSGQLSTAASEFPAFVLSVDFNLGQVSSTVSKEKKQFRQIFYCYN